MPIEVVVLVSPKELRRRAWPVVRRRARWTAALTTFAMCVIGAIAVANRVPVRPWMAVGVPILAFLAYRTSTRSLWTQVHRQIPPAGLSTRVRIGPGGVTVAAPDLRRSVPWSAVRLTEEAGTWTATFGPAGGAVTVPGSAFPGPEAAAGFAAAASTWQASPSAPVPPLERLEAATFDLSFTLTREDQLAGTLHSARSALQARPVLLLFWICGAIGTPLAWLMGRPMGAVLLIAAATAAGFASWDWLRRWPMRQEVLVDDLRREWPFFTDPQTVRFGVDGIETTSAGAGTSVAAWSTVRVLAQDLRYVYLYQGNGVLTLPKASMAEPRAFVAELVRLRAAAATRSGG